MLLALAAPAACDSSSRAATPGADSASLASTSTLEQAPTPAAADSVHEGLLPLPVAADSSWREYKGPGFSFRYPPAARLAVARDTATVRGPTVRLANPNPDIGTRTGPGYVFSLTWHPNPRGLTTAAWVDSLRAETNGRIPPDDPDSLAFLSPPDSVSLAEGLIGLRLEPFCGDCSIQEVYVVGPRMAVVMISGWSIDTPGEQQAQYRLYDAIHRTFKWSP
jgi:hypothetical protein